MISLRNGAGNSAPGKPSAPDVPETAPEQDPKIRAGVLIAGCLDLLIDPRMKDLSVTKEAELRIIQALRYAVYILHAD